VLSLDPAHNLFDILAVTTENQDSYQISDTLRIEEVDLERAFQRHFEAIARALKREYRYLQPLGLDTLLDLVKDAPGSEEFIYLQILLTTMGENTEYTVYDFPPTGLALRILSLPLRSRRWAEKLLGLRKEILELRETIARIRQESPPEDPVIQELFTYHRDLERLIAWLRAPETEYWVVTHDDRLSIEEAKDILTFLKRYRISGVVKLIANRVSDLDRLQEAFRDFPEVPLFGIPALNFPPVGREALERFPGLQDVLSA